MARAGVAVATLASLGMGGVAVATAGAATSSNSTTQTLDGIVANTQAALGNVEGTLSGLGASAGSYVQLVEDLACFPLELLLDSGPPYPPPGTCEIG